MAIDTNHPESHTVLVTGGAGFLGGHLCDRLLEQGHRVICMDNLMTGSRDVVQRHMQHAHYTFIEHDVIDAFPVGLKPTQIYNLACPASPRHYQKDPIHTVRTCVMGSLNVLELAVSCGATILQASTSEIYGDPKEHPQREQYLGNVNPVGPRACYDEGKRCAETLFADYARKANLQVKIARIFNTYGPGMSVDDGRVVSTFISQALAGEPLTVYGDGSQTRSVCYVDDLIAGLIALMNSPDSVQGPVNLGSTEELTVREIAERVCELAGRTLEISYLPLPTDDPLIRRPDISLARKYLDWVPTIPFEEGLRRTIAYFAVNT